MKVNIYELMMDAYKHPYLQGIRETTISNRTECNNPDKIGNLIRSAFHAEKLPEEHTWMLSFDSKMHMTGIFELSHGSVNQSLLSPASVYQRALLAGAVQIVLVHNHPSGVVTPSEEDKNITKRLIFAGRICGVRLIDHIIIGGKKTYSMNASRILEDLTDKITL